MASAGAAKACARMRRAIGHAFSQTETMRDMVPLNKPLTGTAVATAIKCQMPSRAGKCTEGVACGGRRLHGPPRGGLVPSAPAMRSIMSGTACASAARFNLRLTVRLRSALLAPITIDGRASERSASSMAHSASLSLRASTNTSRRGSTPRWRSPCEKGLSKSFRALCVATKMAGPLRSLCVQPNKANPNPKAEGRSA